MSVFQTALVRRGLRLCYATFAYNCLEGVIAILAGLAAGSIALVGFGADSLIEVTASLTAIWRLRSDSDAGRRERSERISLRIIGALFLALAAYVAADAVQSLIARQAPEVSLVGLVLAAASLVVMPSWPMQSAGWPSPWAVGLLPPPHWGVIRTRILARARSRAMFWNWLASPHAQHSRRAVWTSAPLICTSS